MNMKDKQYAVDGASGRSTSSGRTARIPASLFRDRRLSVEARMLMAYLTSLPATAGGGVELDLLQLSTDLIGCPPEVADWIDELGAHGYVTVVDRREEEHRMTVRIQLERAGEEDEFQETMESLSIPSSLQPFYADINMGLKECVPDFIVPENEEVLQRIVNKVAHQVDEGCIDDRGPVGLLIHMVKKAAQVPPRDFCAEEARA